MCDFIKIHQEIWNLWGLDKNRIPRQILKAPPPYGRCWSSLFKVSETATSATDRYSDLRPEKVTPQAGTQKINVWGLWVMQRDEH